MTLKVSFSTGTQRFGNSYTMTYNSLLLSALNPVASVKTHTSNGGKITASTSWLHYNHIGNVMGQSNATGTGWTAQCMDAYGNAMTPAAANSTGVHTDLQHGTLGITAKPYDAAAGAYYFYQRWYDPKIGAFTSWDPNPPLYQLPYGFVEGNPIEGVDLNGEAANCGFVIHPDNYTPGPRYLNDYIDDSALTNLIVGAADAMSFGIGMRLRDSLYQADATIVDTNSMAYNVGEYGSMFIGLGRMAYAGAVKIYASKIALSGAEASAFREMAKRFFRFGIKSDFRKFNPAKYKTDEQLLEAAGRTNKIVNGIGINGGCGGICNEARQ